MSSKSTANESLDPELHRLLIEQALVENLDPVEACNKARSMSQRRRKILLDGLNKLASAKVEPSFDELHDLHGSVGMMDRAEWRGALRRGD